MPRPPSIRNALADLLETPSGKRELAAFLRSYAVGINPEADLVDVIEVGALLRFASRLDAHADEQEAPEKPS